MADKKNHLLITAPVQVCSLRTEEEVNIFMIEKKISMSRKNIVQILFSTISFGSNYLNCL